MFSICDNSHEKNYTIRSMIIKVDISVLKLLKMAKGIRSLLDTVGQALPQVGNLGGLFFLLFFIFAALGVELFGKLGEYFNKKKLMKVTVLRLVFEIS